MSKSRIILVFVFLISCLGCGGVPEDKDRPSAPITTSGRGVILPGEHQTVVQLKLPPCAPGKKFLVQGVLVCPEVEIGATMKDIVNLVPWAAQVPVYQEEAGGSTQVGLTVLGQGPRHLTASLPGGQPVISPEVLPVTIKILGTGAGPGGVATASHRFEFNVHVWGYCGVPFRP